MREQIGGGWHWTARIMRAGRTVLSIIAVAFVAELLVMFGLGRWLDGSGLVGLALIDAAILAVVIAPLVYFLVMRPLRREHERRVEAEHRADLSRGLALTDPLTAVLNRRGILASLIEAMAQAERYERPLTVAMMDLDNFKRVNDVHGHAVGDEVLQRVVELVQEGLRRPDRLGRFGGDEFLLVLPETPLDAARVLTDRIEAVLREAFLSVDGRHLDLTASFGAIELERGESLKRLLDRVDGALYSAKKNRRQDTHLAERPGPSAVTSRE